MSGASPANEPRVLLDGLSYVESPRWHDGRLWFAHWGTGEIVAVDLEGRHEVVGRGPAGYGWSIDWLPDGRLLVTGNSLRRAQPDGSLVRHADLGLVANHGWNEVVVDGRRNVYVNGIGLDFLTCARATDGIIALLTPDGEARKVAGGIDFPNGMVITPDNSALIVSESFAGRLTAFDIAPDGALTDRRVWAEGLGPHGITLDAEGAIWVQTADTFAHSRREGAPHGALVRIREGGEVLQRIEHDRTIFAVMLGGPNGKTLFILAAEWRGIEHLEDAVAARTGQILVVEAPAAKAGWP
jgi:sugar lactone lactonase YvrE